MYKIVFQRHGFSTWNKKNIFTGWTDVDLVEEGIKEAKASGQTLKKEGFSFDIAYTSILKRAIRTLWITLQEIDQCYLPVTKNWRLNERHYGALQGKNKTEVLEEHGEQQFMAWRRGYDTPPPKIDPDSHQKEISDPRYSSVPKDLFPHTECLKDTVARVLPYWQDTIVPTIKSGKKVLVSAHGNSLRALVKHLDNIPDDEITGLNIPYGIPLVYELDQDIKPIKHYYLADDATIAAATNAVANQGKK